MLKKYYSLLLFILLTVIIFYYWGNYMDKRDEINYNTFAMSNLKGQLVGVGEYARGTMLQLEKDTVIFYPRSSKLNNNSIFRYTAEKGDSIIKKTCQDTLILKKKNGSIIKYTFLKFP